MPDEKRKPVVLAVLDGWGMWDVKEGNAIKLTPTPNFDNYWSNYPHTLLGASGKDVGLPPEQDGNSEAGHMNIGAGRVIKQDSVIVSQSINEGTFFRNPAFLSAIQHIKKNNSSIHLIGLLTSEQSAHADPDHILALITLLRIKKIKKVYLHLFTDGRDSYQYLSIKLIEKIQKAFTNGERIGTIIGRYYAMDRIKQWDRTEAAYNALILGKGRYANSPRDGILQAYNRHETDEFISPTVIKENGKNLPRLEDNDAIIFFNLRSDRVRQLSKALVKDEFKAFKRKKVLKNISFITLTDFGPDLPGVISAYPAIILNNTLPRALINQAQLYIAETEKYAHVTYFLNGGHSHKLGNEEWKIINSPQVKSYKEVPEMSADELTDYIVDSLNKNKYDFILVNYANPDMVGHTGDLEAGIKAVAKVDECIGQLYKAITTQGGTLIITADHGNIEELIDLKTGQVDTAHSSNPVPFIIVNDKISKNIEVKKGVLADIAPTILHMMNIKKPKEMGNKILCQYQINQ
ncbi:MAG: 2,3-bisphosphoglycerate-independent phosphoglycerate mutase [bacterium]|nr:2,3-bisphosphoglycerate-independent phosphoglycerate mutase [bacterium]